MRHRIWNLTTQKWVKDEDGNVCEFDTIEAASYIKEKLDDLKQLNPDHCSDIFVVQGVST